ncbi:xanthine dehydrogenase family protein molybdopterin-binding subunit [Dethiosulfatarculus sandiegensis]|uniref:Isoquinoline 1-oxidoreductase n=1 Tax=Dethiosulfatarculus sandiegensis TaxID=1429043 RepID=A0A0D2GDD7_9BACT|nr:xanthine dehydrogenase family protein molybdopterin-binding subunit [Dethiosulfatarculus sandiegensis]KIX12962.1 isoquinoline 1-oxidoreductase [Dethiosulfatarculus sandiegensis]
MKAGITRRLFLKSTGLVLAVAASPTGIRLFNPAVARAEGKNFKPHAFLEIAPNETVIIWVGQTEMGQGTHTGLPMVIAEELGADWQKIKIKMAGAGEAFKDPVNHMQVTGGSTSIRHRWDMLRQVGAAAREMLIQAAANEWGVAPSQCKAHKGKVLHPNGRSISFGQLSQKAAALPVPKKPELKQAKDYNLIGTSPMRVDIPEKVAGKTVFGFDFKAPGMCVAVVARAPAYGAKPESFDQRAAMTVKGVISVVPLKDRVAVCAENTYAALKGREALAIKWTKGSHPDLDDAKLNKIYQEALAKSGAPAWPVGDAKAALARANTRLKANYKFPYLSHVPLEPMNCTAQVEKDRCRLWAPTQGQTIAQKVAAGITKLPPEKIEVITPYVGGGFGRRIEWAVLTDAVLLSQAMKRPVKVIWTREDDFKHDFYRPACHTYVEGGLDSRGRITSWFQKNAASSIMQRLFPRAVKNGLDPTGVEGAGNMIYNLPNRLVEFILLDLPIPVGFLRSVGHTYNIFTVESFMDELAAEAGKDPLEFRLAYLKKGSRERRILNLLGQKAGWGKKLPKGRGLGLAVSTCYESTVGHVAEVSVDLKTGQVKVHKLVAALDCGTAVFPDAVKAQIEGGAVMALSIAFKERVSFAKGGVATANFDDYPLLTMADVPEIEAHLVGSGGKAGGVGEPPIPTVAPAVANAIFAASGVRLRELPFDTQKLKKS